jgi:hypothetical protein
MEQIKQPVSLEEIAVKYGHSHSWVFRFTRIMKIKPAGRSGSMNLYDLEEFETKLKIHLKEKLTKELN